MTEQIVLVDESGKHVGVADKLASHHSDTPLHLAFSCYVFNTDGKFLVTQRSHVKKVWPDVWTNSVCGHPAPGESMDDAIVRRLNYELGMIVSNLQVVLPNYRYKTPPYKGIIENEVCPVYVASASSEPKPNPNEVDAFKWVTWSSFVEACQADTKDVYSWWCKDQVKLLKDNPIILKRAEASN